MTHWRDYLDPETPDGAYLPWKRVEARVGISRTTAWRLQRTDAFPKPCVLSPGRVGYKESEIEAWKASRGQRAPTMHGRVHLLPAEAEHSKPAAPARPPVPAWGDTLIPEAASPSSPPRPSRLRPRPRRAAPGQLSFDL